MKKHENNNKFHNIAKNSVGNIKKHNRIGCVIDNSSKTAHEIFNTIFELHDSIERIDLPNRSLKLNAEQIEYDAIITIGGDGTMLKTMRSFMHSGIPIYGINCGSIGFLLNKYHDPEQLIERITNARPIVVNPLIMDVTTAAGYKYQSLAINEVSLLRSSHQSAKIAIKINEKERMKELVGDGIILATTVGSSAYNFAAHGPLVPINSNLLLLTPIAPFRPRRWQGAIIARESEVEFTILESYKRPVNASADSSEIQDAINVKVRISDDINVTILFDSDRPLEDRILDEQFYA